MWGFMYCMLLLLCGRSADTCERSYITQVFQKRTQKHVKTYTGIRLSLLSVHFVIISHHTYYMVKAENPVTMAIRTAAVHISSVVMLIRTAAVHISSVEMLIRRAAVHISSVAMLIRTAALHTSSVAMLICTAALHISRVEMAYSQSIRRTSTCSKSNI